MNRIYKVVWNAARGCYMVGSELVSCHSRVKSSRSAKMRKALLVLGAVGAITFGTLPSVYAEKAQDEVTEEITVDKTQANKQTAEAILLKLATQANKNIEAENTAPQNLTAEVKETATQSEQKTETAAPQTEEETATEQTPSQHSIHDENGYYVHNGGTYNSLTKDGLWVGGTDNDSGFHVDNDGNITTTGTAEFKRGASMNGQKITNVADGENNSDAVNFGQLKNISDKVDINIDSISELNSTINENTASINKLNDTVDTHTENISSINTTVEKNSTDIIKLDDTVTKNMADISNINSAVEKNIADIQNINGAVEKNMQDISNIDNAVTKNMNDIQNIDKAVTQNINSISELQEADKLNVKYDNDAKSSVTLGGAGVNPVKLTNVAEGTNDTDAVNVAQLENYVTENATYTGEGAVSVDEDNKIFR